MAQRNAEDILKVQPEGPYLLGGHSYGGAVALEIALLLESWGHEVGLLVVRGLVWCSDCLAAGELGPRSWMASGAGGLRSCPMVRFRWPTGMSNCWWRMTYWYVQ